MQEVYKGWHVPDSELLAMEKEGRDSPHVLHSLGNDHRVVWSDKGLDADGNERNARWTVFFRSTPLVSFTSLDSAVRVATNRGKSRYRESLMKRVRSSLHDRERSRMTTVTVSDVSRDKKNFDGAKKALSRLIMLGDGGAALTEIFDESLQLDWCRRLMRRLIAAGLARSNGPYRHQAAIRYFAEPALWAILQDDSQLAAIIWPRAHSIPQFPEEEAEDAEYDLSEPGAEPAQAIEQPAEVRLPEESKGTGNPTLEETVGALLQISSALLENVVFIREKISVVEKELIEIRKYWQ